MVAPATATPATSRSSVVPLIDAGGRLAGRQHHLPRRHRYRRLQPRSTRPKRELETAYEELQSTNEELETTNEELQSTIEELETTNEELQSTNEELETMNEELQSTNEELETINEELRERGDELNAVNTFLGGDPGAASAAASSSSTATARSRSGTRQAEDLWGLRADEVRGQHLLNLDIGLPVEQLRTPIRGASSDGAATAPFDLSAVNRRGRAVYLRVTCRPLETSRGVGGVIMLLDTRPGDVD